MNPDRRFQTSNRNRFVIIHSDEITGLGSRTREAAEARAKSYAKKWPKMFAGSTVVDSAEHPERFNFKGTK